MTTPISICIVETGRLGSPAGARGTQCKVQHNSTRSLGTEDPVDIKITFSQFLCGMPCGSHPSKSNTYFSGIAADSSRLFCPAW